TDQRRLAANLLVEGATNLGCSSAAHIDPPGEGSHNRGLHPLSGAHHLLQITRRADTVHVYSIRSDHPVDVNQAAVCTSRRQLFLAQAITVLQACAISLSESDVAGGILVKKGVHEE